MKHHIPAIILGTVLILQGVSCSKHPDKDAGTPVQTPPASPKTPDHSSLPVQDIYSLSRNGEKVTIAIKVNFTPCKAVVIYRNAAPKAYKRITVAQFKPEVRTFEDTVPDDKAYWYWIKVIPMTGESKMYGPLEIGADAAKLGKYAAASSLNWTITRTQSTATITWNFTEKIKEFTIKRTTNNSVSNPKNRTAILKSKEWNSSYEDKLPDPDANYWYWIEVTLQTGTVINEGPRKAEFVKNQ